MPRRCDIGTEVMHGVGRERELWGRMGVMKICRMQTCGPGRRLRRLPRLMASAWIPSGVASNGRVRHTPGNDTAGFRWLVPLPDLEKSSKSTDAPSEALGSPRSEVTPVYGPHIMQMPDPATVELVATLKQDLDARVEEIARLQEIIATQAETIARITVPRICRRLPRRR